MSLIINSYLFGIYTWRKVATARGWNNVAMSSDGVKQTAVADNSQIYTSINSGITWTARDSSRNWRTIAMSSDGVKQTAAV